MPVRIRSPCDQVHLPDQPTKQRSEKLDTIKLVAPDISCNHCKGTIENVLGSQTGVQTVSVNVEEKEVNVTFDPQQISQVQLEEILEDEGFPVV